MGKHSDPWRHLWKHGDGQLPNTKSSKFCSFDLGIQGSSIFFPPPCVGRFNVAGEFPLLRTLELSRLMPDKVKQQPRPFVYDLPQLRQGLGSNPDVVLDESLFPVIKRTEKRFEFPKKFLVFDRTGDKTTLMYSSGFDTPVQCHSYPSPNPINGFTLNGKVGMRANAQYDPDTILTDKDSKSGDHSVLHEDTDEIEALLYSGDEDDRSEGDEETSTGHSPCAVAGCHVEDGPEDWIEEVASSALPSKRIKISEENYVIPTLLDTAGSARPLKLSEYQDDAESSYAGGDAAKFGDVACLSVNKRQRKETIRETVSILQRIIPGGRGKDPVAVLDEAIRYLRSLKLKAKSLGLSNM